MSLLNPKLRTITNHTINKNATTQEMNVDILKLVKDYSPSIDCLVSNFGIISQIVGTDSYLKDYMETHSSQP